VSGTGTADRTAEEEHGDLRRGLGFRDLVVHGLLFIAPMVPVGVYGTLDATSHERSRSSMSSPPWRWRSPHSATRRRSESSPGGAGVRLRARGLGKEAGFAGAQYLVGLGCWSPGVRPCSSAPVTALSHSALHSGVVDRFAGRRRGGAVVLRRLVQARPVVAHR
jgi:hypothetical protein